MRDPRKKQSKKKRPLKNYYRLKQTRRHPAPDAVLVGPANPKEMLSVSIHVRRRIDGPPIPDLKYWQKRPPGRRKFLSVAEFAQKYGAAPQDLRKVVKFATAHGMKVVKTNAAHRVVTVSGTVSQMQSAFAVDLGIYESPWPFQSHRPGKDPAPAPAPQTYRYRGRDGCVLVPKNLAKVIIGVFGLDNRILGGMNSNGGPKSTVALTVAQVAELYNFPKGTGNGVTIGILNMQTPNMNGVGVTGNYNTGDFQEMIGYNSLSQVPKLVPSPDPGNNSMAPALDTGAAYTSDQEITQDICIASSVAPDATIRIFRFAATEDGWTGVLKQATLPESGEPIPSVISCSYYLLLFDDAQEVGMANVAMANPGETPTELGGDILTAISTAFQDAANMGTTIFVATGDQGSTNTNGVSSNLCRVEYPGSDPWVTSCGGTTIRNVKPSRTALVGAAPFTFEETVWNDDSGATGGGVSDYFQVPPYQQLPGFPQELLISKNPGGKSGRGVPDVAGNASLHSGYPNFVCGGATYPAYGTSAVAPLYAGLMAIIVEKVGPVGFLNPTLYCWAQLSAVQRLIGPVFNDITVGNNNLNNLPGVPFYKAGKGWDPCTGWGSINGNALLAALQLEIEFLQSVAIIGKALFGK